ncbi:MAG: hypothetical protein RL285_1261, partial [Bacteroidota bacterium]
HKETKKNWGRAARGPRFAKFAISAKRKINIFFFAKVFVIT